MQRREEWPNWREDLAAIAIIHSISLSFSCILINLIFNNSDVWLVFLLVRVDFKTLDMDFIQRSRIKIYSSFSRKFYISIILVFKNCYLVCLGGQIDEFDGVLIVSLGFLIHNCQRTKPEWQIVINIMWYFHLIASGI